MRLIDCFVDLIAYVAYFLDRPASHHPPFDRVRADVERLIAECRRNQAQGNLPAAEYDLAQFAIFAWIDEAVLNSDWAEKGRWQGDQLQRLHYQTSDAGEIFYQKLNTLGPHQRDVREIYYLCLALGFTGRFIHPGDEHLLEQLKISNLKLITGSAMDLPNLESEELFPEAMPVSEGIPGLKSTKGRFT
ncbi:MAG: DotU family type IV/VI secretion system protein, partial [Desulfobacterales bacterium]